MRIGAAHKYAGLRRRQLVRLAPALHPGFDFIPRHAHTARETPMPVIPAEQAGLCPARESRNPVINVVDLFVDPDAAPAHRKSSDRQSRASRLCQIRNTTISSPDSECAYRKTYADRPNGTINSRTLDLPDGDPYRRVCKIALRRATSCYAVGAILRTRSACHMRIGAAHKYAGLRRRQFVRLAPALHPGFDFIPRHAHTGTFDRALETLCCFVRDSSTRPVAEWSGCLSRSDDDIERQGIRGKGAGS
jgi:hypothetical protein